MTLRRLLRLVSVRRQRQERAHTAAPVLSQKSAIIVQKKKSKPEREEDGHERGDLDVLLEETSDLDGAVGAVGEEGVEDELEGQLGGVAGVGAGSGLGRRADMSRVGLIKRIKA